MNKDELKVQALLERVGNLTAEYENKVADLRVELTMVSNNLRDLEESLKVNEDDKKTDPSEAN